MTLSASTRISIDAAPDAIWAVMLDLSRYHEWNPFIVQVDGAAAVLTAGSEFALHVRWPRGGGARSAERVTRLEPPTRTGESLKAAFAYRFTGPLASFGLVRATRVQTLEQAAEGQAVLYRSEEVFDGLLHRFIPLSQIQAGFDAHAKALKARAEALRQ